jgi:hypothetical protein
VVVEEGLTSGNLQRNCLDVSFFDFGAALADEIAFGMKPTLED